MDGIRNVELFSNESPAIVLFCTQLLGSLTQTRQQALECEPLVKLGNITLNPCGLIANTLFNDVIKLNDDTFIMQEKGIAWSSDLKYMFAQPEGFNFEVCPADVGCTAECCDGDEWSCEAPYENEEDGECYRYYYPNDNTTQYLYEVSFIVTFSLFEFTRLHGTYRPPPLPLLHSRRILKW